MGDVLFGSGGSNESTSSSSSGNNAYPAIAGAMTPALGYTTAGGNMIGSMLGLYNTAASATPGITPLPTLGTGGGGGGTPTGGGGDADTNQNGFLGFRERLREKQGLNNEEGPTILPPTPAPTGYSPQNQVDALTNFSNSTGMDFVRSQGIKALEGSQAGRGMLQSGATGTKLVEFGQNLGKTYLNQYMDKLFDFSKLGLGAAGALAGSGGWSKSSGTGSGEGPKQGLVQSLGPAAIIAAASDARLKEDITVVGEYEDGLPKVEFRYRGSPIRYAGVIAQDVARLRPAALGPTVNGFLTVADKDLFPRRITNG